MRYILLLQFLVLINKVSAQTNFNKIWVNGGGYTYSTTFNGTQTINTKIDSFHFKYFAQGNSNICDSNGKLILVSDGMNIYDSTALHLIEGGDTLVNPNYYIYEYGWSALS